jgi:3'(2'), 5'-bisphosphate nucleotidase
MTPSPVHTLASIASRAGAAIEAVRARTLQSRSKSDGSPVTEADTAAEEVILVGLNIFFPDIPVVSEEDMATREIQRSIGGRFFLVDPLDGTKEFIAGRPEYTVNIALIESGVPVAGVVYAPASGDMFIGDPALGSLRASIIPGQAPALERFRKITARSTQGNLTAVASRSHSDAETESFLGNLNIESRLSIGSSLKFCLISAGEADVYPRFGPTMEWDTAAGHAVLLAAGGSVTKPDGAPFLYGKSSEGYRNGPFVAWGKR